MSSVSSTRSSPRSDSYSPSTSSSDDNTIIGTFPVDNAAIDSVGTGTADEATIAEADPTIGQPLDAGTESLVSQFIQRFKLREGFTGQAIIVAGTGLGVGVTVGLALSGTVSSPLQASAGAGAGIFSAGIAALCSDKIQNVIAYCQNQT
jgi:hypothetical protein